MIRSTKIVACNWKAFLGVARSVVVARAVSGWCKRTRYTGEVIVAPSFAALHPVSLELDDSGIRLAAQNVSSDSDGPYTGAISLAVLKELGCAHAILGHSEVRAGRGLACPESDGLIAKKFGACLSDGISPILCIGETLDDRRRGKTARVLSAQLSAGTSAMDGGLSGSVRVYVAYEPVWAISSNAPKERPVPETINDVIGDLRELLAQLRGSKVASRVRFLYGGSVDASNVASYVSMDSIDGVLVGGASTDPKKLVGMLTAVRSL